MTIEKPRHLRHDTGATITRRALMVAGFFLGLLTYTSFGAARPAGHAWLDAAALSRAAVRRRPSSVRWRPLGAGALRGVGTAAARDRRQ